MKLIAENEDYRLYHVEFAKGMFVFIYQYKKSGRVDFQGGQIEYITFPASEKYKMIMETLNM